MDNYNRFNIHRTDIQSFSDVDIEQALSKLSEGELEVLEQVLENEAPTLNIKKRGIIESDLSKRCDSPYGCNTKNSNGFDSGNYKQIITFEQQPGKNERFRYVRQTTNNLLKTYR